MGIAPLFGILYPMATTTVSASLDLVKELTTWAQGHGLRIIAIVIGAWILRKIISKLVSTVLRRALHLEQSFNTDLDREKRMQTFITLINAILSVTVWIIASLLVLQELGIQTGPLLTGAGVLGVGLAFGAQSLMKDFISGLFIVLENQYRVGDEVELDSTAGTVEHLGIRTTVLRDEDGNVHFVPNGLIQRTTNKSMGYTILRFSLVVSKADHGAVKEHINKVGDKIRTQKKWLPHFSEPLRYAEMGEVTDKQAEFIITARVKTAYHRDIAEEFRKQLAEKLQQKAIKVRHIKEKPLQTKEVAHKDDTSTSKTEKKKK